MGYGADIEPAPYCSPMEAEAMTEWVRIVDTGQLARIGVGHLTPWDPLGPQDPSEVVQVMVPEWEAPGGPVGEAEYLAADLDPVYEARGHERARTALSWDHMLLSNDHVGEVAVVRRGDGMATVWRRVWREDPEAVEEPPLGPRAVITIDRAVGRWTPWVWPEEQWSVTLEELDEWTIWDPDIVRIGLFSGSTVLSVTGDRLCTGARRFLRAVHGAGVPGVGAV